MKLDEIRGISNMGISLGELLISLFADTKLGESTKDPQFFGPYCHQVDYQRLQPWKKRVNKAPTFGNLWEAWKTIITSRSLERKTHRKIPTALEKNQTTCDNFENLS